MHTISFLLLFPLVPALLLLLIGNQQLRSVIVRISALVIAAASVYTAVKFTSGSGALFSLDYPWLDTAFFAGEMILGVYLLLRCTKIKAKEWWIPVLIAAQIVTGIIIEVSHKSPRVENAFYIDNLSVIMVLIIGIIGSLITVYALSYMKDYHHHHAEIKDRRRSFFFILFMFLSAMFGIVLCNDIKWLFFFWEITTLCSFELIGYSKTDEATRNAFKALGYNTIGGVAFSAAIVWLVFFADTPVLDLNILIAAGTAAALIPAVLISFAGLTKSAQMPFSSWLLGAMVAPTPVSALLHSSTMVKAGVFIVIKFAPVLQGTFAGQLIALIGGITFLITSLLAVTQRNAKLVLAYSTIANLGLVIMCAGVGTAEALWAAVLLIIFHAISKGLLFLGVGTIEHKIGSRDIEDMDGLIVTHPWMAFVLVVGILGMFLAPFGMLISKWVSLQAFIESNWLLAVILAFGSAPTLFFWTKWIGKLAASPTWTKKATDKISGDEQSALGILAFLTIAVCALFPVMSNLFIDDYLSNIYNQVITIGQGNLLIMFIMFGTMALLLISFFIYRPKSVQVPVYLAGTNTSHGGEFTGAMGLTRETKVSNYYLVEFLNNKFLNRSAIVLTIALYAITLGVLFV